MAATNNAMTKDMMGRKQLKQKGKAIFFNRSLNESYEIYNVVSWERIPDNERYHHYRITTEDDSGVTDIYEVPADTVVSLPGALEI